MVDNKKKCLAQIQSANFIYVHVYSLLSASLFPQMNCVEFSASFYSSTPLCIFQYHSIPQAGFVSRIMAYTCNVYACTCVHTCKWSLGTTSKAGSTRSLDQRKCTNSPMGEQYCCIYSVYLHVRGTNQYIHTSYTSACCD